MATIQPPPIPDTTVAISACSTSAKHAFADYLALHPSRWRISRSKRANIISWLMNDQRTITSQVERSQRHHSQHTYRYEPEEDILFMLPSEGHPQERRVVAEEEILSIIEQEHLLSKHAGQNTTWASINKTYYGISC